MVSLELNRRLQEKYSSGGLSPVATETLQKLQIALGKLLNYAGNQDIVFPQKMQALRHLKAAEEIVTKAMKVSTSLTLEQEADEKVKNLFSTIENLMVQLKALSSQKLTDQEKNTLKLYMLRNIMPTVKNLLRGGVYEFEGHKPATVLTREDILSVVREEIEKDE